MKHGRSQWTRTTELEVCQPIAARNPLFVSWQRLELFSVPPRGQYRYYDQAWSSWQELEIYCMFCVPTLPTFAYYPGAFGNGCQLFSWLLCKTAITKSTVMLFVCFIRAAEFGVPDLFLPTRFRALQEKGCVRKNEKDLILLSRKMKANIMF